MSEPLFDHTPTGDRRLELLAAAEIAWLSTVRPDGRPHLVPVWFIAVDDTIVMTSLPDAQKVRNIRSQPHVSLALDDSRSGHEPVIAEGIARLDRTRLDDPQLAAYYRKYARVMREMSWPEHEARAAFTAKITIELTRFITF